MKKYKIGSGEPKKLKEEDILKHKDFDRLVANYDKATKPLYKRPLYKDPRSFLALLVILLIVWLISSRSDREDGQVPEKQDTTVIPSP